MSDPLPGPGRGAPLPMVMNRPPATSVRPAMAATPAAAAARRRGWDGLLICLAVYILTGVGRIHQIFTPLGHAKPLLVACLLAIVLYTVDHSTARRLGPVIRLRATRWALAMLFWGALSVLTSLHKGFALAAYVDSFPKTIAMFVIVIAAMRDWKDVERLSYIYFLSVAIYAVVVMWRFQATTENWKLEALYYYDANDYATLAVTALPIGIYFLSQRRSWLHRAILVAGMGCMLLTFTRTGSRGGLFALLVVAGYMVVRFKAIQTGWRVGAVAVLGMLIIATASQSWWERMDSILHPQTDYNVAGTYGRLQVWKRGIGYMIQRPLTGVGYANFPVAEGTLFALAVERGAHGKGSKWGVAHNSYIEVGAELGLPGLVCYLGLLLAAFAGLRSVRAFPGGPRDPPNLARALTASLLGFVVGAFFLSLEYSDLAFALCAFATALAKTTRLARVPKYARPRFRMAR